jgi:hypothetical protein
MDVKLENAEDAVAFVVNAGGAFPMSVNFLEYLVASAGMRADVLSGGLHALTRHEGARLPTIMFTNPN